MVSGRKKVWSDEAFVRDKEAAILILLFQYEV